jgi:hypothetical protein
MQEYRWQSHLPEKISTTCNKRVQLSIGEARYYNLTLRYYFIINIIIII